MSTLNRKGRTREALAAARAELMTQLEDIRDEEWELTLNTDGEAWTVADVLRHLASAEASMARLIQAICAGGEGASPDFDLNRFNRSRIQKAQHKSVPELLIGLEESRAYVLEVIDKLDAGDWTKLGRHGSLRIMSVAQITDLIGTHERDHARDIRATLDSAREGQ